MIFFLSWQNCWKKTCDISSYFYFLTSLFRLLIYLFLFSSGDYVIIPPTPPLKGHSVSIFRRKFRHVKYIHKHLDAEKNVSFSSFQIRILKFWLMYEILYHTNMSLCDNCKFSNITRSEGWVGATWAELLATQAELLATQAELLATQAWVTCHPVQNASWVTCHPPFFSPSARTSQRISGFYCDLVKNYHLYTCSFYQSFETLDGRDHTYPEGIIVARFGFESAWGGA